MWISDIGKLEDARKQNKEWIVLELDDDDVDLFGLARAVKSLYHNQTSPTDLCAVTFAGEENHFYTNRAWNIPALRELLDSISKISTVTYLGFQWLHKQNRVPVELLSNFFQKMKHQVDTLEFISVSLMGGQEHVQEFTRALQSMPGLKNYTSLDMTIFCPNNIHQSTASPLNLDSIFTTLCGLPMMSCLEIECSDALIPGSAHIWQKGVTSIKTLQCLLSSTEISSLHLSIGKLDVDPEGLESLVQAIGKNSNILDLGLYFLSQDATPRTQHNNATTPALFLAKALQINTTLQVVSVKFHEEMPSAEYELFLLEMANAIRNNPESSVWKLTIDGPGTNFPPAAMDAFRNLLKTNYTIEDLQYIVKRSTPADGCTLVAGEKQNAIEFYLRLNAKGRKRLMSKAIEKVPRAQLISTLASVSNDLDALYYYLRLNPCLFLEEANHSYRGRSKTRSRMSSPENTSKDDEILKLKKELGDAQKEIKRLKKLLDNKNTDDA